MKTSRIGAIAFLLSSLACAERGDVNAQGQLRGSTPGRQTASSTAARRDSVKPVVHVHAPDTLRGLYVNRWAALGSKLKTLINVARKTEVNALVIDVKDDRGLFSIVRAFRSPVRSAPTLPSVTDLVRL